MCIRDSLKAADGFGKRYIHAGEAGELFGNGERLREEALDFSGALYQQLVFVGKLIHTLSLIHI